MISQPFKIASNISIPGSVVDKLTVSGNISSTRVIYASGGNSDLWNSTYSTVSSLSANYILAGGNSKGADIIIGTNDNYALKLETAGTTKMTVTSAGFVGIGNTDPASILEINDSTAGQKDVTFTLRNGNFGWWKMTSSNANTAGFLRFASGNSAFTPLTLDATTGNVGITNNTPTARLDIADTTLAGSGGLAGSVLNLTQTWNTSGSPTAIKLNVTDTNSNAASLLMDLRVGSRSSYSFGKTTLTLPPSTGSGIVWPGVSPQNTTCSITRASDDTLAITAGLGSGKYINIGGNGYGLTIYNGQIQLNTGLRNVYLSNDDNHILTQRNGGNPQAYRLYNTYTDATTFERLNLQWQSSVFKFGTEKGSIGGLARAMELQTDGTTRMTITSAGSVGIGTTLPATPLHIVSGVNSNLYLGTSDSNDGIHEIRFGFIPAPTNSYAASIVGIRTGGGGRGNLEFRVAGGGDATNAIQSDTAIRITSADVQVLKPLTYAQDVLAIGDNYNSGVKAFKFTRNENKAAIWSVPSGSFGKGDIRFTTGDDNTATAKTESDATVIIARKGGLILGNSYISTQPTGGTLLVSDTVGIGTTSPVAKLDIADTTYAGSSALSGSALNITQTWSTSGSPTAIKLNVTNTNSGAASNLLDLQVDNISRFKFTKNGAIDFGPSNLAYQRSVINSGTGQLTIFARGDVPTQAYAAAGLYNGITAGLFIGSGFGLQWSSGSFADGGTYDLTLSRRAAANLRLGGTDVAAPVAQTFSVQSVLSGTTNTAGTNLTFDASQGTGTGTGGSIIFRTAPVGSSGNTPNALSAALTIDSSLNTNSTSNFVVPNVGNKGFWVTGSPTHSGMVNGGGLATLDFKCNAETVLSLINNGSQRRTQLHVGGELGFSSDLTVVRDAANILAQRNGINPQAFRLYNTFTNTVSTFERLNIKWDTDILKIGTEKGSTVGLARPMEFQTDGTTRMTITTGGDVGIGTTSPAYKLAVNGGVYISAGNGLNIDTAASGIKTITASGNDVIVGGAHTISTYGLWARGTRSTGIDAVGAGGDLQLTTAGVEKVRVTTAGNVGIGTTSPSNKLDVIGNAFIGDSTTAGSALAVNTGAGSVNKNGLSIINSPAVSYTALSLQSNWSDGNGGDLVKIFNATGNKFIINNTGNVGIGTTTTSAKLDVRNAYGLPSSTNGTIRILSTDAAGTAGVGATLSLGGNAANASRNAVTLLGANESTSGDRGYLGVFTNGTGLSNAYGERLRVDSNGSIIINPVNNNLAAVKGLIIRASSGQTANLIEWQNSSNVGIGAVSSDGSLGIGTTTPSEKLTVVGVISSTNIVYASGGNSNLWNSAYASVNSISANGATTYTTVNTNSANWNSVYSSYNSASGTFLTGINGTGLQGTLSIINSNFPGGTSGTSLTNLGTGGSPQFTNLTLTGNLSVLGDLTYLNTNVSVTSALSVVNAGTGPALYIKQSGTEPIAYFDGVEGGVSSTILFADNGFVGLGTATPNNRLAVVGVISSTNIVYASGGNSDLWNSTYTSVNANSANGASVYTTVNANSANWNSTYTTVNTNSANYILDGGNLKGSNITIGTKDNFNLNLETADTTRVTVTSAGNVGIGTSNPGYLLDLNGSSRITNNLFFGTSSLASMGMVGNNLTINSLAANPVKIDVLQVTNTLQYGVTFQYGDLTLNKAAGVDTYIRSTNQDLRLQSGSTYNLLLNSTAGNVGIGTITPNEKLTVAGVISSSNVVYALGGNSNLWNSAYTTVNSISANGATTYTTVNANSASWSSVYTTVCAASANNILDGGNTKGANIFIGTNDAFNLNLETANATRMTITSAGNVGIGTTSPQTFFDVNVTTRVGSFFYVDRPSGNSTAVLQFTARGAAEAANFGNPIGNGSAELITSGLNGLIIGNQGSTPIVFGTTNLERVRILATGEVGIGTTTPGAKLHVVGNGIFGQNTPASTATPINVSFGGTYGSNTPGNKANLKWDLYNSGAGDRYGIGMSASLMEFQAGNSGAFGFYPNAGTVAALTITSGSNVGIGTTSPAEKLDVVGNVKVSGHFSAVTKSFLIDHPTKADKKLQYGVVESNQHSVLVRGKTAKSIIELPEEWSGLVHEDSVTVQLTPVGTYQKLFVILQDNEKVVVGGVNGLYNYTIYGERKDVDRLQTEI